MLFYENQLLDVFSFLIYSVIITNNFWNETKITQKEDVAIKILSFNKYILIQKLEKGSLNVVLNQKGYIDCMYKMLSDSKLETLIINLKRKLN